jgi:hypothetical protein
LFSISNSYSKALLFLSPLVLTYLIFSASFSPFGDFGATNLFAPLYFVSVLFWLALRVAKRQPEVIWSAAFWLPLQSAVFYGFGPLVEVLGNETTKHALSLSKTAVTSVELFRANTLSTLGIFLLLLGFWLHMRLRSKAWSANITTSRKAAPKISPERLGLFFVLFGAALKYGIMKPAQWGMIDLVVAGVVTGLGAIVDVGFGILAYCAALGNKRARAIFMLLWPIHVFLATLSLAKLEIIFALLIPALFVFVANRKVSNLLVAFAFIGAIFMAAQPWVHFGRAEVYQQTGNINQADYGARIELLRRYIIDSEPSAPNTQEQQGWWTRLSFVGPQAYAMNAYDNGQAGSSLGAVWVYFIPRAIWRDKPILIGPGLEFYRMVSGNFNGYSFLGLSIYGDLYWQFGWPGLVVGCLIIGWVFAMMACRSVAAIQRREFILIPAVLLALQVAILGPNKFVVNGIIGPLPIYIAYLIATHMFLSNLGKTHRYPQILPNKKLE